MQMKLSEQYTKQMQQQQLQQKEHQQEFGLINEAKNDCFNATTQQQTQMLVNMFQKKV